MPALLVIVTLLLPEARTCVNELCAVARDSDRLRRAAAARANRAPCVSHRRALTLACSLFLHGMADASAAEVPELPAEADRAEDGPAVAPPDDISVSVKWSGRLLSVSLPSLPPPTLGTLKRRLEEETAVPSSRLKLLGMKPATPADDALLSSLVLGKSLMMMGAPDSVLAAQQALADAAPEVLDDLEEAELGSLSVAELPENLVKLRRRIDAAKHRPLRAPRPGAKLLVLDIDYTLYDHVSTASNLEELMRPHLHDFLARSYAANYDIIIWSATSMRWVERKMQEMGVLDSARFQVLALVDHGSMVTVGPLAGRASVFDCKPLAYLWHHYPCFSADNTIMFDDLRRNFVMNPGSGLRLRPFRNGPTSRDDDELLRLADYLEAIAGLDAEAFRALDHSRWERYLRHRPAPE